MGRHKRERTEQLVNAVNNRYYRETAQNEIEQHNFEKLIRSGFIVKQETKNGY